MSPGLLRWSFQVEYEYEKEKWAKGERFGQFGLSSGVDIRELWPTVEVAYYAHLKMKSISAFFQEIEDQKVLKMHRTASEAMRISIENKENEELRVQTR